MLDRTLLILLSFSLAAVGQTTPAAPAHGTHTPPTTLSQATTAAPPVAILHTTAGDMKCELFPSETPKAVANFIGLAKGTKPWKDPATEKQVTGKPLYDGVIFHRVIPSFMIQTGDPSGTGHGDVGFEFADELRPDLTFDKPGRLAMANRGPNTNSSQFFITETPLPFLNPCFNDEPCMGDRRPRNSGYVIFGQCDDATVELVKKISRMPCTKGPVCTQENSLLQTPVKITHIEIVKPGVAAKPSAAKSTSKPTPKPTPKPAAQ